MTLIYFILLIVGIKMLLNDWFEKGKKSRE